MGSPEGFLCYILGFLRVAQHPVGDVEDRSLVSLNQPPEGAIVAGQGPLDKLPLPCCMRRLHHLPTM
jgi:hypothetical protein